MQFNCETRLEQCACNNYVEKLSFICNTFSQNVIHKELLLKVNLGIAEAAKTKDFEL